jgi:hypothetical protein
MRRELLYHQGMRWEFLISPMNEEDSEHYPMNEELTLFFQRKNEERTEEPT